MERTEKLDIEIVNSLKNISNTFIQEKDDILYTYLMLDYHIYNRNFTPDRKTQLSKTNIYDLEGNYLKTL